MGDTPAIGMVPGSVSVGGTEENRPVMTYIRTVLFCCSSSVASSVASWLALMLNVRTVFPPQRKTFVNFHSFALRILSSNTLFSSPYSFLVIVICRLVSLRRRRTTQQLQIQFFSHLPRAATPHHLYTYREYRILFCIFITLLMMCFVCVRATHFFSLYLRRRIANQTERKIEAKKGIIEKEEGRR